MTIEDQYHLLQVKWTKLREEGGSAEDLGKLEKQGIFFKKLIDAKIKRREADKNISEAAKIFGTDPGKIRTGRFPSDPPPEYSAGKDLKKEENDVEAETKREEIMQPTLLDN